MHLINILLNEGKLKDNLHDFRWKLISDDPEVVAIPHELNSFRCEDCGGYVMEMAVDALAFRSMACMKCGSFCNFDYQYQKVHEAGGGFGSVQLVTKDHSLIANFGFRERFWKKTLYDLRNELVQYPNVDLGKSFVSMRHDDGTTTSYWLGHDVEDSFYDELFGVKKTE